MSESSQPNAVLRPHNAACKPYSSSFHSEDIASTCGTLLDFSDPASVEYPDEKMETRYERINQLIGEILLLVDLLFADHGIAARLPGGAA